MTRALGGLVSFNVSVCRAGGQQMPVPSRLQAEPSPRLLKYSLVSLFPRLKPDDEIIADSTPLLLSHRGYLVRTRAERSCAFRMSALAAWTPLDLFESLRIISAGMSVNVWRRIFHKSASSADLGSLASAVLDSSGKRLSLDTMAAWPVRGSLVCGIRLQLTRFPDQEQQRRRSASNTPAVSQPKQPPVGLLDHGAELLFEPDLRFESDHQQQINSHAR